MESEKRIVLDETPEAQQTPEEQVKTLSDEELEATQELLRQEKERRAHQKTEEIRRRVLLSRAGW